MDKLQEAINKLQEELDVLKNEKAILNLKNGKTTYKVCDLGGRVRLCNCDISTLQSTIERIENYKCFRNEKIISSAIESIFIGLFAYGIIKFGGYSLTPIIAAISPTLTGILMGSMIYIGSTHSTRNLVKRTNVEETKKELVREKAEMEKLNLELRKECEKLNLIKADLKIVNNKISICESEIADIQTRREQIKTAIINSLIEQQISVEEEPTNDNAKCYKIHRMQ